MSNLRIKADEVVEEDFEGIPKWLPEILEQDQHKLVHDVGTKLKWEIDSAMAFVVALLEDVNAHPEAAAVNDLPRNYLNKY